MIPAITLLPASSDTDRSTAQTVAVMYRLVDQSYRNPAVIAATREACRRCAPSDPAWRKAQDIWEWVHSNIRFLPDEEILNRYLLPEDLEYIQRPELLLATREGDCDCFTTLTAAMLKCAGVEPRIITIAASLETPNRWSHVYAAALDEAGKEIPMDTSHGDYMGWEASRYFRRREWAA